MALFSSIFLRFMVLPYPQFSNRIITLIDKQKNAIHPHSECMGPFANASFCKKKKKMNTLLHLAPLTLANPCVATANSQMFATGN